MHNACSWVRTPRDRVLGYHQRAITRLQDDQLRRLDLSLLDNNLDKIRELVAPDETQVKGVQELGRLLARGTFDLESQVLIAKCETHMEIVSCTLPYQMKILIIDSTRSTSGSAWAM